MMDFMLFSSGFFSGGACWFAKMFIFELITFTSSSRRFWFSFIFSKFTSFPF